MELIGIIIGIVCAIIAYNYAKSNGKSVVLWPILAFLFPLFGLLCLWLWVMIDS